MDYCKNCGELNKQAQPFCSNCGAKFDKSEVPNASTQPLRQEGKKRSKKTMITLSLLVFFVLAGLGTHLVLSTLYKPEKILTAFQAAVEKNDVHTMSEILENGYTEVEYTDKEIKAFISYLKNENKIEEINKELYKELRKSKNGGVPSPIQDANGNDILLLEKGSKKLFLYQQYTLKVIPFEIFATSNYDNAKVQVNGKKAKKIEASEESISLGKFLPGHYEVKGTYKGEYTTLETEATVKAADVYENEVNAYLSFEGEYVSVYANQSDAILFINGKSTGKTVEELNHLGPVATDGSMTLHAELPGEKKAIKTNEEKILSESTIYLYFDEEVENEVAKDSIAKEDILRFMESYITQTVASINAGDFSIAESYHDPDGKTYNEAKNYLHYLVEKGITEEVEDINLVSYKETENGFKVYMTEQFIIYYADGSAKRRTFDSSYTLTWNSDEEALKVYTLDSSEEIHQEDVY